MKWNKLTVRELTKEEQEEYGLLHNSIWQGRAPDIDEEVLVAFPLSSGGYSDTRLDTWLEFDIGVGFENTDNDVIYWVKIPQYNGELDE